jgi:Transglutaminase-like superfamily
MRKIRRFAQLTMKERSILLRALLVVGVARTALWLLPVAAGRKVVGWATTGTAGYSQERLIWAIRATSRFLPGATCLTQALAAQALLGRSGYPSQVEIGVAVINEIHDAARRFQAHAWLVCKGQVVLGGPQIEQYSSLLILHPQE